MQCSFCNLVIPKGTGKIIVKKDGSLVTLCSSKCEKNMFKLKRNPRKQKWISKRKTKQIIAEVEVKEKARIVAGGSKIRRK